MLNWVDYKHVRSLSIGLSRITGDKGTLGGRWRAKLHIIKHYQNWALGIYKIFYSVTIFVVVSSLSGDKHLLFLFFWRSVPFVLVRGVFLSTKIARNTPNSMKENLLLFLLHHATKRSGGDVWLMWGRGAVPWPMGGACKREWYY